MAATSPTLVAPTTDSYLTDGLRLCQVVGIDADGTFYLEDCRFDDDKEQAPIRVKPRDLPREWEAVEPA